MKSTTIYIVLAIVIVGLIFYFDIQARKEEQAKAK